MTGRPEPLVQIELNMAAAEDLRSLPGVGPVLSQRIVRFRDVLGGFHDIDDLYEVYGLDSSVVDGAKAYVTVDATLVRPVCLDTVSFRSMLKHPRFDVETTKKLMRARGRGVHTLDVILLRSRLDSVTCCARCSLTSPCVLSLEHGATCRFCPKFEDENEIQCKFH